MTDEQLLAEILDAYSQAELRILAKIEQLTMLGMDSDAIANTLYGRKLAQLAELKAYTAAQLKQLATLDHQAQELLIRRFLAGSQAVGGSVAGSSSAGLNTLIADYAKLIKDSRVMVLRQTADAYQRIIYQSIKLAPLGTESRLQVARKALNSFANEGITAFITKDNRRVGIIEYTEMATRSTLANAQREGRVAGLKESGADLIIINAVPNPSPLCQPYERAILSLSGDSDRYPSLADAQANGLFHPNCRHSFTKYVPGLTKRDAQNESNDYEATQEQRYAERNTRLWNRRLAVADTPTDIAKAKDKIDEWKQRVKDIAEENDLVYKANRLSNKAAR